MSRDAESPGSVPEVRLDVCLHAFEWTQDPQPTANHHLVRLRFHDIEEVILEDFNHQNAILEFKIEDCVGHPDMPNGLEFTFVPAYGLSGIFRAGSAEVVSVVPCDERGNPRPQAEPVGAASSHPPTP